ncbi:uncharacterized protein G2W53_001032 [Senna tora]|uniref:Uncharacterized protein n=1 Tax=Senna tora TaxID=362788 RepID=A0A835CM74_9FABA|nr:uncharacterized protein G2W53_001032 [Senna tora]
MREIMIADRETQLPTFEMAEFEEIETLQLQMEMSWNGTILVIRGNNQDMGDLNQVKEHYDEEGQNIVSKLSASRKTHNHQLQENHNTTQEQGLSNTEVTTQGEEQDQPQTEGTSSIIEAIGGEKQRKRVIEMEVIEEFVRKKGRNGPMNITLTLHVPKPKKRKAVRIEEIEVEKDAQVKRLKASSKPSNEEETMSDQVTDIVEVT